MKYKIKEILLKKINKNVTLAQFSKHSTRPNTICCHGLKFPYSKCLDSRCEMRSRGYKKMMFANKNLSGLVKRTKTWD